MKIVLLFSLLGTFVLLLFVVLKQLKEQNKPTENSWAALYEEAYRSMGFEEFLQLGTLLYDKHLEEFNDFFQAYRKGAPYLNKDFAELTEYCGFYNFNDFMRAFHCFGEKNNYWKAIDWAGEDEPKDVEHFVEKILGKKIEWDITSSFREQFAGKEFRRGAFIVHLFEKVDQDLQKKGLRLLFLDKWEDTYHFTVVSKEKFDKALELNQILFHGAFDEKRMPLNNA